jgi:hypothetical protein
MIVVDSLLLGGLRFVLDKVATAVDAELNDEGRLREELLALQMRHELGEVGDAEYLTIERDLLARMRELREQEAGGPISFGGGGGDEVAVEIGFGGDEGVHEPAWEPPGERHG